MNQIKKPQNLPRTLNNRDEDLSPQLFQRRVIATLLIGLLELMERIVYYGVRSLIVIYMLEELSMEDGHAFEIYGKYTLAVYLLPIFAGFLIDRLLDKRLALVTGMTLIVYGCFRMGNPGETAFMEALVLLSLGHGLIKPTLTVLFGDHLPHFNRFARPAFTAYYMAINIGALIASTTFAMMGEEEGFPAGFRALGNVAVGMLLLTALMWAFGYLEHRRDELTAKHWNQRFRWEGLLGIALMGLVAWEMMAPGDFQLKNYIGSWPTELLIGLMFVVPLINIALSARRGSYRHLWIFLLLVLANALMWAGFEMASMTQTNLNNNAGIGTDGHMWNPVFALLIGAVLIALYFSIWQRDTIRKNIASIFVGIGWVLISALLVFLAMQQGWHYGSLVILIYFIGTLGEMLLSTILMPLVYRLFPSEARGSAMGFYMGSFSAANAMSAGLFVVNYESPEYGDMMVTTLILIAVIGLIAVAGFFHVSKLRE